MSLMSSILAGRFFTTNATWEAMRVELKVGTRGNKYARDSSKGMLEI